MGQAAGQAAGRASAEVCAGLAGELAAKMERPMHVLTAALLSARGAAGAGAVAAGGEESDAELGASKEDKEEVVRALAELRVVQALLAQTAGAV